MNLHNEIMNIQIKATDGGRNSEMGEHGEKCYKEGHRDARHSAAEMALKYDNLIDDLENHFGKGIIDLFKRQNGL